MTFSIITIFPKLFEPYLKESILGKAVKKKLIKFEVIDLRKFAKGKHKRVDDEPYGGGPGMVMKVEPLAAAVEHALKGKRKSRVKVILTAPGGSQFTNKTAASLAKRYDHLILIAGRYEGFDERIERVVKNIGVSVGRVSIGPYVLTGGEIPSLTIVDAVSRQVKGVLGKGESLEEKRHGVGVPNYTRPEVFERKGETYRVPRILLSGDHKKIENWRKERGEQV